MTKRPDIQGIRGLAIASVLAFHLNEIAFPAGFLGVDIFFVLSGYLMSLILSKEHELNADVFRNFYKRRFKRIVPLYAILVAALTIIVPCFLMRRDVLKFCQDYLWAALFATNIHTVLEKKDYYAELFDSNVLIHTWSLGVEIQYYLIVPFIILAQRRLAQRNPRFPFLPIILAGSLIFQVISSPNVSFNLLPSRVWQFLAGGLSHEFSAGLASRDKTPRSAVKYEKLRTDEPTEGDIENGVEKVKIDDQKEQPSKSRKPREWLTTDLLSFGLLALVLCPWLIFPVPLLRIAVVAMTSGLLVYGNYENRQGFLLTNRPIVYLGDISYVVYLAHWPIIVMWKSVADTTDLSFGGVVSCLALTAKISITAHHTLEQYFIRAKTRTSTIVVAVLYGFLAIALLFNVPMRINDHWKRSEVSSDVATAIKWNEAEAHFVWKKKGPFKECVDDPEGRVLRGGGTISNSEMCVWNRKNATGSLKMLVVGNSFANRASTILGPIVAKNFPQVAQFRRYSKAGCLPTEKVDINGCDRFIASITKLVHAMKPDITYFIYNDSERLRAPIENPDDDEATQEFSQFFQTLADDSRVVILDEFFPFADTPTGVAASMAKRLTRNQATDDLKGTLEDFRNKYANYFARLDRIDIPNLIRHNTSAALCGEERGVCWWYNRKNLHSYFTENSHLSADGLELLRESYTNVLKKAIDKLSV